MMAWCILYSLAIDRTVDLIGVMIKISKYLIEERVSGMGCEGFAVQSSGERSSGVCIGTFRRSELLSKCSLCMMLMCMVACPG
jgi:hypothetical protein